MSMTTLFRACAVLACLVLPSVPAFGASEVSRGEGTTTVGQNVITADNIVTYVGYTAGETLTVTLAYSATCNIVFNGLKAASFLPPRVTTGTSRTLRGTPQPERAAQSGEVTFAITFKTLSTNASGEQSGTARLDLKLGVDRDCNLATGDVDGVDTVYTLRAIIAVTSASE
jgi:hypothetical protein